MPSKHHSERTRYLAVDMVLYVLCQLSNPNPRQNRGMHGGASGTTT